MDRTAIGARSRHGPRRREAADEAFAVERERKGLSARTTEWAAEAIPLPGAHQGVQAQHVERVNDGRRDGEVVAYVVRGVVAVVAAPQAALLVTLVNDPAALVGWVEVIRGREGSGGQKPHHQGIGHGAASRCRFSQHLPHSPEGVHMHSGQSGFFVSSVQPQPSARLRMVGHGQTFW